jgi:hypothetical protein
MVAMKKVSAILCEIIAQSCRMSIIVFIGRSSFIFLTEYCIDYIHKLHENMHNRLINRERTKNILLTIKFYYIISCKCRYFVIF